ncbi:MAG: CocE/NonD family hydrolase [Devosia sp.]
MSVSSRYALAALLMVLAGSEFAIADDFTDEQLAEMAETPALKAVDLPFLDAPAPDTSHFVTVSDGTRLAISVYFPEGFHPTTSQAPAVFEDSVYGRREDASTTAIELYLEAGYVVIIGDARGFAASYGHQDGFNSTQQTADEAEVIAWIAAQPWSNGKVAAIGHSISATFADSMTGSGAPALEAAIIRASDFDLYAHNMFPGGAPNLGILDLASELMAWHAGLDCSTNVATCGQLGFAPVDGDSGYELLQGAIRDHQGNIPGDAFADLVYRDDIAGTMSLGEAGGIARVDGIKAAGAPARVAASWMDGMTALSALTRFTMADTTPMEVVIGATSHPGGLDADPFATVPFGPATPSVVDQFKSDIAFVDRVLAGETIGRSISYLVLGTDTWKTTPVWPPVGVEQTRMMLSPSLMADEPSENGQTIFTVDPSATTGAFNRWAAQRGKPIYYGNLQGAPDTRMTFDAPAVTEDQELLGSAELCLMLASDQTDGLVIAYLEDVAPDGRVTYLTEGQLRLIHRATMGEPCDTAPGTERTFDKADGSPVVPGETMRIELSLLPVAARIAAGHHLRLSLAGADAGWFDTLTGDANATWTVYYGSPHGSSLLLPMRPWTE